MPAGDTEGNLGKCGLDPEWPSEAQAIDTAEKVASLLGLGGRETVRTFRGP